LSCNHGVFKNRNIYTVNAYIKIGVNTNMSMIIVLWLSMKVR